MDHRRLIPQARHIKQIVLWMDIIRSEQFAARLTYFCVMAGHSRPKDGVASARLCPGHPRLGRTKDVDARDKPGHDEL
jgi:hypothetical protein